MIKQLLNKGSKVVTDGAMGTYFYEKNQGKDTMAEYGNLDHVNVIEEIHKEYLEAGARVIRTNTFSTSSIYEKQGKDVLEQVVKEGHRAALNVSEKYPDAVVVADIGPVEGEEDAWPQYKAILDAFIEVNAKSFWLETFSSPEYIKEITSYIKEYDKESEVLVSIAIDATGHTVKGYPAQKLLDYIKSLGTVDFYGLNCGIGPTHMYNMVKSLIGKGYTLTSVLPNAGYPMMENGRMVYPGNPKYFAQILMDICELGVPIVGGCCGTTPHHIEEIVSLTGDEKQLQQSSDSPLGHSELYKEESHELSIKQSKKKIIMAELDPPYNSDISNILGKAKVLKEVGVDVITIADSPLGRPRLDSVAVAAKIKRDIQIDTMPHLCCRDTNHIGLRSKLLACHMEDIHHILAVTGDPVPSVDRGEVRGVFHLHAIALMDMIRQMNEELFLEKPMAIGGALNLGASSKERMFKRIAKKVDAGATFFLTQPIYDEAAMGMLKEVKDHFDIGIIAGIMPLISERNALYMHHEVPGIRIPEHILQGFAATKSKEEAIKLGEDIAYSTCKSIANLVDGYYFMTPFNRVTLVKNIMERLRRKGYVE